MNAGFLPSTIQSLGGGSQRYPGPAVENAKQLMALGFGRQQAMEITPVKRCSYQRWKKIRWVSITRNSLWPSWIFRVLVSFWDIFFLILWLQFNVSCINRAMWNGFVILKPCFVSTCSARSFEKRLSTFLLSYLPYSTQIYKLARCHPNFESWVLHNRISVMCPMYSVYIIMYVYYVCILMIFTFVNHQ